jgi:tetratricopeptide (TPR) repeat protein
VFAEDQFCSDDACKKMEKQYYKKEYEKIISAVNPSEQYSEGSVFYLGMSYTNLADKAATLEAKDKLYRQAIAFKYFPAYMSLHNLYSESNPKVAMEFVRAYAKTNPDDPAPFLTLGEVAFQQGNYKGANKLLIRAKSLSSGHTAGLDWLLFKTNYILGNYRFAKEVFESALAQSRFEEEIRELKSDPRFAGIEDHIEFNGYKKLLGK